MIWKRTGVSPQGVPVYEGKNYVSLLAKDWDKELSPYDLQPDGTRFYGSVGFVAAGMLADGGLVVQVPLRGSGGAGLNNGAGTDLLGFSADGRRRWVHQLAEHKGIAGLGTVDDITLTSVFYSCETIAVDADGLALGGFCEPRHLNYAGYWIDHPNLRMFKLPDGRVYATWGDNADGRHPWFRLENQDSLKRTHHAFRLADERARELAKLEPKPPGAPQKVPQPEVRIPKLAQPFAIDGDLEKWRQAGIKPVAVVGHPARSRGRATAAPLSAWPMKVRTCTSRCSSSTTSRCSIRWSMKTASSWRSTAPAGLAFSSSATRTRRARTTSGANRFFMGGSQKLIEPHHAPRIVKVLKDAQSVTERQLLENLYGVDLSKSSVVVTEFKLPIDKVTFAGAEQDVFQLGPGKSFWIGFFIDDNDTPYTDVQRFIQWPATFGMFNPPEDGTRVFCE